MKELMKLIGYGLVKTWKLALWLISVLGTAWGIRTLCNLSGYETLVVIMLLGLILLSAAKATKRVVKAVRYMKEHDASAEKAWNETKEKYVFGGDSSSNQ